MEIITVFPLRKENLYCVVYIDGFTRSCIRLFNKKSYEKIPGTW